jgi:hypothetical protein
LEELPRQPSAAPFHDWNERIDRECYRAVAAARIKTLDGKITRIVNTLSSMSFNFGPTLLTWLEGAAPRTYAAMLEADRLSREVNAGHGNAMAMPYHHSILPLASRRDKTTEVRWGIADFQHRFGRLPEGMWLPETAVDDETLDVLAEQGILFTVLAPHQVRKASRSGLPGRYRTSSGREIALFVYDGSISHDVAFGDLLKDATRWEARLVADGDRRLTSIATDGETYGHHHAFGDMALAAVIDALEKRSDVRLENFASYLARHFPRRRVELVERTSWSCAHGIGRWSADCGCKMDHARPSQQQWRTILRTSLQWLADQLHDVFEREARGIFADPWAARDAYGDAVLLGGTATADFVRDHSTIEESELRLRGAELLEMERNALRMFTSCGWFHDDIGGIESRQVLCYAMRAIELAGDVGPQLSDGLREHLVKAESNYPHLGTGSDIYDALQAKTPPAVCVAAGYQATATFAADSVGVVPPGYAATATDAGVTVTEIRTGRSATFETQLEGAPTVHSSVRVRYVGSETAYVVPFLDMPESARTPMVRALRAQIIRRAFPDDARAAIVSGRPLDSVARLVFADVVQALALDASVEAVQPVLDLLDLFDLLELPIPFDTQTTFYRVWRATDEERTAALAPVARRLGFE